MIYLTWAGVFSKITKIQGRRGSCPHAIVLLNISLD